MTRSEKLSSVLDILEFKLTKEFSSLVELMQEKIDNERKLSYLINYQNNYALNKNKDYHNITNIKLNHKLLLKIQTAIDTQYEVVNKIENAVNKKILLLQKDRSQTKALEALVGRYRQQEIQARDRSEQKELDDQFLAKYSFD